MAESVKVKGLSRKNRWATAKGRVVSVRFSDVEYLIVERCAKQRGLSTGEYLRWLSRVVFEIEGFEYVLREESW